MPLVILDMFLCPETDKAHRDNVLGYSPVHHNCFRGSVRKEEKRVQLAREFIPVT